MNTLCKKLFLVLLFSTLLTVLLVLGIGAQAYEDDASAAAADAVARTGAAGTDTYYQTLAEAIAAAPEGGTVTLIADTSFSSSISIERSLTLTGTGTITFTGTTQDYKSESAHALEVDHAVDFTINGNVKLTSATKQSVLIHITAGANVTVGGNAELTVTGSHNRSYCIWHSAGAGATVTVCGNAYLAATGGRTVETVYGNITMRMTGGTVEGNYGFLHFMNEGMHSESVGTATTIEITGGRIETNNNPIHLSGAGTDAKNTVTVSLASCTLICKYKENACVRLYANTGVDLTIGNGTTLTSVGHGFNIQDASSSARLTLTGQINATVEGEGHFPFHFNRGTVSLTVHNASITAAGNHHLFFSVGSTTSVNLTGNISVSGSLPMLCVGAGTATVVSTANLTTNATPFRCQTGTLNVTVNDGKITSNNHISYTTWTGPTAQGVTNFTVNGGELTTNNKANMLHAVAGTLNINIYGGNLHDGSYMFSYSSVSSGSNYYYAKGLTTINMSSGSISSVNSIWISWNAGMGDLRVVKGDITLKTTNQVNMAMFNRWGKPDGGSDSTATSNISIEGGNFHFANASKYRYTSLIGIKDAGASLVVTISGGTMDAANYGVRAAAGTKLDLTMTGGTLACCYAKNASNETQTGSVIYSQAADTKIRISGGKLVGTGTGAAGINIKANVTADVELSGSVSVDVTGYCFVTYGGTTNSAITLNIYGGTYRSRVQDSGGLVYMDASVNRASTVNIYGGLMIQPLENGGDVVTNYSTVTTVNIYGITAIGGRALITNKGAGTATTKPGESLDATYSVGAPVMVEGAGVRLATGSNGLRFVSTVDEATVSALTALADAGTVSYGTLIFPASYLEELTYYTHASLPKYLDIPAVNGIVSDGEGGYIIRAAVVNLKEKNYGLPFIAIAYVKYEVDGVEYYRYAALHELANTRSMKQVARLALLDVTATSDETYCHASTASEGSFSRYTTAQQAVLSAYGPDLSTKTLDLFLIAGQSNGSGYTQFPSEFTRDNAVYASGFSHVLYSGLACSGTNGGYPRRHGTLTPVPTAAGYGLANDYFGAELGLAETLSATYNAESGRTAAILKYADGGTFLSDVITGSSARQGNWTSPSYREVHGSTSEILSGNLYRNLLAIVRATVSYYEVLGYEVNICGAFWMQGCAERNYYNGIPALGNEAAVSSPTVQQVNALYTDLFQTFVSDLRADLGSIVSTDLSEMPVVAGSISEAFGNAQTTNNTRFVEMQAQMVSDETYTYLLSETRYLATGTNSGDSAHYTAEDMLFAGRRLGETFLMLTGQDADLPAPDDADYVARVGDEYYTDLAYAINTAPANATVTLLRDLTLYGPLNISTFHKVTVDGNGYTVHSYSLGHAAKIIGNATDVTLHNFRLINHRNGVNNAYGIYMYAGATLSITGENSYLEAYRYALVINLDSTVNIHGGTFTTRNGADIASAAVYIASNSTVNILGGTFTGVGSGAAIYVAKTQMSNASANTVATLNIIGGTFTPGTNAAWAVYVASPATTLMVGESASLTAGKTGTVYNANTASGTSSY